MDTINYKYYLEHIKSNTGLYILK